MNTLTKTEARSSVENSQRLSYITPPANILETTDGYLLEVEMPGVAKEGPEITVENGELTILGRRLPLEIQGRELFRESRRLDYRRVFEIDPSIDTEQITAKIDQGVLTLHLPKSERVKPRKIKIA
ncbi:MAG: hspA 2 [Chthoniobacteraceae bacterium]|nr:hspA 2 [Chthoniobacteraceae bacterium]